MPDNLHPGVNTGFIEVAPKLGDFVAGGETGILDIPVNAACDWRAFLPTDVTQLMKKSDGAAVGDTNACVSFAGKQSVETQLNQQILLGVVSPDNLAWLKANGYIDANGSVLLSARFTAKMSGTLPATGNTLPNVWQSLHANGAVPEALWPMPNFDSCTTPQDGWAIYYEEVPQVVMDLGKQFAARFPVLYEWLVYPGAPAAGTMLKSYLSVSPLEIATAVCAGWNTDDPIHACGPGTQHATMLFAVEPDRYDILDHYNPYKKQFAGDYTITYGMRGVVGQSLPGPAPFHYTFSINLSYGAPADSEVKAMQTALQTVRRADGTLYMKPGVFGSYGPQSRAAVDLFQRDRGIHDPQPGEHWGPQTRAAMNTALANQ